MSVSEVYVSFVDPNGDHITSISFRSVFAGAVGHQMDSGIKEKIRKAIDRELKKEALILDFYVKEEGVETIDKPTIKIPPP